MEVSRKDIIYTNGEVLLIKRNWYEIYRKGWSKHVDFWGNRYWIKFNWKPYVMVKSHDFWVAFDFLKTETHPLVYGKYLICRKDGKIHWETWNSNGWAYNHNEIVFWARIKPPYLIGNIK